MRIAIAVVSVVSGLAVVYTPGLGGAGLGRGGAQVRRAVAQPLLPPVGGLPWRPLQPVLISFLLPRPSPQVAAVAVLSFAASASGEPPSACIALLLVWGPRLAATGTARTAPCSGPAACMPHTLAPWHLPRRVHTSSTACNTGHAYNRQHPLTPGVPRPACVHHG